MTRRGFGHRLSVGWLFWYTRHVPSGVASERRDELISDLWEHNAEAARSGHAGLTHQFSVIGRTLAGMPADLSWRRAARAQRPPLTAMSAASAGQPNPLEFATSKRWKCKLIGHRERRFPYPGTGDGGGYYLLCRRCGHAREYKAEEQLMAKIPPMG